MLKPAPAELTLTLWSLKNAEAAGLKLDQLPEPPRPGLTSATAVPETPESFYRSAGYHLCGPRAVRMDMLERLADQIRPLLAWRKTEVGQTPPKGSSGDGGFVVTPEMMSVLGCSSEEFGNVLKALGFRLDRRHEHKVQQRSSRYLRHRPSLRRAEKSSDIRPGCIPGRRRIDDPHRHDWIS